MNQDLWKIRKTAVSGTKGEGADIFAWFTTRHEFILLVEKCNLACLRL